jgi:hypothetical protein
MLTSVSLPTTLEELTIDGQTQLASVSITSVKDIKTLKIVNAPKFDSFAFIRDRFVESVNDLSSVDMEVNWTSCTTKVLNYLLSLPTCRLRGTIKMASGQNINFAMKQKLVEKFDNVDDKDNDLYIEYNKIALTSITVSGPRGLELLVDADYNPITDDYGNIYKSTYQMVLSTAISSANDVTRIEWSIEDDGTYAEIDTKTGLITITKFPEVGEKISTLVTATAYTLAHPEGIQSSPAARFRLYYRDAEVGDYIYYDGTFGPVDEFDGSKTVVGRCFYVAPRLANGEVNPSLANPNSKWNRLMVSLDDIYINGTNTMPWGIFPIYGESSMNKSLYYIDSDGSAKNLTISGGTIYDVPNVRNFDAKKFGNIWDNTEYTDSSLAGQENDGFAVIPDTYREGYGFGQGVEIGEDLLPFCTEEGYKNGDIVNVSYTDTLYTIKHRNFIIDHVVKNGNINGLEVPLEVPTSGEYTEIADLGRIFKNITAWASGNGESNPSKWIQLMFPFASACYAYEPEVLRSEKLNPKFKAHRWACPAHGLLVRCMWQEKHGNMKQTNVYTPTTSNYHGMPENSNTRFANFINPSGPQSITYKSEPYRVRPITAF